MNASVLTNPDQASPENRNVEQYLPFVRRVVARLARRLPSHVHSEELMGAAVVGLLEALDRYDASRATGFEAFAEFRVKGAVLDELRRRDLMARDARWTANQVEQEIARLTHRHGRPPEEDEIAAALGMTVADFRVRLEKIIPVRVVSLEDLTAPDLCRSGDDPFEQVAQQELTDRLVAALAKLSERQQLILQLYYFEDLTLKQIGQILGVTESRVCQLLSETVLRLRATMHVSTVKPRRADRATGDVYV